MSKFAQELLLVGSGGAIGAIVRYLCVVGQLNYYRTTNLTTHPPFPLATLTVNLAGCFAIGLMGGLGWLSPENPRRLWLAVGFLGSLTTFSTFGYESWQLLEQSRWGALVANVLINLFGGLGCVLFGIWIGRMIFSPTT